MFIAVSVFTGFIYFFSGILIKEIYIFFKLIIPISAGPSATIRIKCYFYILLPLSFENSILRQIDHADPCSALNLPAFELISVAPRVFPCYEVLALRNHERYGLFGCIAVYPCTAVCKICNLNAFYPLSYQCDVRIYLDLLACVLVADLPACKAITVLKRYQFFVYCVISGICDTVRCTFAVFECTAVCIESNEPDL